ncbi:MAG: hypothetical protein ACI974_000121 [Paraglaciecola sp.]|jgi:hypothetical protein
MKNLLILLLLTLCACENDDKATKAVPQEQPEVTLPALKKVKVEPGKATIIDGSDGTPVTTKVVKNDLNGDGEEDRLEVAITKEENDGLGFKRQLVVYSGEGADLDAWYTAEEVILSTEHGGMMGDPLESVEIENGTIAIKHFGGSREKWDYVHRFRWQNGDFELIGTTTKSYDSCTEFAKFDYNLSTGQAEYSITPQDCSSGEIKEGVTVVLNFKKKMAPLTMNGFKTGEHELNAPEIKETVYF